MMAGVVIFGLFITVTVAVRALPVTFGIACDARLRPDDYTEPDGS